MNAVERRKLTVLSKYDVENISQLPSVQDKRRNTFKSKRNTVIFYQEPRVNTICGKNLTVYSLNKRVADDWLNTYHPFHAPRGNVLSLGLVEADTIYCMMAFKKSRNPNYFAQLSRMWMLPTYDVIDGYDILSNYASDLGVSNLVAYVNMSFENYKDYESIGMTYIRDIPRTKWWIRDNEIISDASRRQKRLSENEMIFKGYVPVYDCGTRVYIV